MKKFLCRLAILSLASIMLEIRPAQGQNPAIISSSGISACQDSIKTDSSEHVSTEYFAGKVAEDPTLAAEIYNSYSHGNLHDTPAPRGYKPFYISHYGRHGSRRHTSEKQINIALSFLRKAADMEYLTKAGEELRRDVEILAEEHSGMTGELTSKGAEEHRMIAGRMYDRFTPVFRSKSRDMVDCIVTQSPRSIVSMTNFATALNDRNPKLDFSFNTGGRYQKLLNNKYNTGDYIYNQSAAIEDSLRRKICRPEVFAGRIFTVPDSVLTTGAEAQSFAKSVFMCACICEDVDYTGVNIFKYFTTEEIVQQGIVRNDMVYAVFGNSLEYGSMMNNLAKDLLKDFVTKADEAIVGGSVAANLRFGHDTGIMPLVGLMGIKEVSVKYRSQEAHNHWIVAENVPMAVNLQMIFYRGGKDGILVKLLYNEQETVIPAVSTYYKVYYRWEDLRNYFIAKYERQ